MKLALVKGSTDVSVNVFIQDSSSSVGAGLTGLVYNSSGLVCYYCRPGSAAAQLTLATQTVTGSHSDGGFVEISSANMPGIYRLDLSDAILASGVDSVVVMLKGATNMAPCVLEIQLTNLNLNDGVRAGLTALPNAAADGAGGLPISDGGGLDLDTYLGRITANVALASVCTETRLAELGATNIPADIDTLLARLTAARAGYLDNLNGHTPQTGDSYARIGANGAGLSAVPWNASWDAEVESEVADALNVAIPGTPTADSINQRIKALDELLESGGSGDAAAILGDTNEIQGKLPAGSISDFDESSDTVSIGAGGFPVGGYAAGAVTAAALAADAAEEIADTFLGRNIKGGSNTGRLVKEAFQFLRNRVYVSGGVMYVTDDDDSTTVWSANVTTTAGNPISDINPV